MEREFSRPPDRPSSQFYTASSSAHPPQYQSSTAQPAIQMPFSDPFHTTRDPFLPAAHARKNSSGPARAWLSGPQQGSNGSPHPHQRPPASQPTSTLGPSFALPSTGLTQMSIPYDASRRSSLGGVASPTHYGQSPINKPQSSFANRAMAPPTSPPQLPPPSISSLPGPAPRGPPATTPFTGMRDLNSTNRSSAGMSIMSLLGGGDEQRDNNLPIPTAAVATSVPRTVQSSSPARARSSSMRESILGQDTSSSAFGEPRAVSAFNDRPTEDRREGLFGSPQLPRESIHSFRNFQPDQVDLRTGPHESAMLRPTSQPAERAKPRKYEVAGLSDAATEGRFATFRNFGEPSSSTPHVESTRHEHPRPFHEGVTWQPRDRDFNGLHTGRDSRKGEFRFESGSHGSLREGSMGGFRPGGSQEQGSTRDFSQTKHVHDPHREIPRSSPSGSGVQERPRAGIIDRPITFEEHQRAEAVHRQQQLRKPSDGSGHRALLNLSPDLNRKGRNSPLPQAVQGAQPRHIGPGGDNPGIKMEFGRMFSGLGSGVGSTTPTPVQVLNGTSTPSRLSPMRPTDEGASVKVTGTAFEDSRGNGRAVRGGKNGRRPQEETDRNDDERSTPDLARGNKRSKTTHHHHHHMHPHHHHHRHEPEGQNGGYNMLRFSSNPGASSSSGTHHFHHHHNGHAHPAHHHHHHHHHAPRAPVSQPRKHTTTILSQKLLDDSANQPRQHLGSQLYTSSVSMPFGSAALSDARIKYRSETRPIPLFEGKENSTFTVRVPRWYFPSIPISGVTDEPSPLEEICRHCEIWGSEIYTDDSNVIAAAVHSGWLQGDFGDSNQDLHALIDNDGEPDSGEEPPLSILARPHKPAQPLAGHDIHITLLILPPLAYYTGTLQHHLRSRDWNKPHDGMSFTIHRIDFVDEAMGSRSTDRTPAARKSRIAVEEAKRREAADGLLMFANSSGTKSVRVEA